MKRRDLLMSTAALPVVATAEAEAEAKRTRRRPKPKPGRDFKGMNVLLFITDQQRKTMHFPKDWEKDNLKGLTRLKQNGLTFEHAFCNACMCSPSRATL